MYVPRNQRLLAIAVMVLVACQPGPDELFIDGLANVEGGNPIVPDVGMLPFPSSLYEVADTMTVTGRRLDFSEAPLPDGVDADVFARMDGYSRIPQITTRLDVPFDPSGLPTASDPAISLTPDSPVLLLNLDTGYAQAVMAEPDRSTESTDGRLLMIRPLRALAPNQQYGVLVTDALTGVDGEPLPINDAMRALRDGISTDSTQLELQRADVEQLFVVAEDFGVDTARIVSGWTFHTRSIEQLADPLIAMHDRMNTADLGPITWISDEDDGHNRAVRGEFTAPNFLNDEGKLIIDASGLPIEQGTAVVPFLVAIPSSVTEARPVITFGHGFFSHMDETLRSSLNHSLHEWSMSAVSTNFIGFSEDDYLQAAQGLGGDVMILSQVVDQQLQSQANFTALGRITRDVLVNAVVGDDDRPLLNVDTMNYMGISNGGTQGAVINVFSPIFDRASLIVGGGGWAHIMQRASQWNTLGVLLETRYAKPQDLQLALSLFQLLLDPVDAMNFADHLVDDRYPGRDQELRVTMHEAVGDCQVNNLTTEWVARTADVPLLTPSPRDVWGLETLDGSAPETAGVSSALFMYDEGYESLPDGNEPRDENGAHTTIRSLDSYHANVGAFLETGLIQQFCDGPCDPN